MNAQYDKWSVEGQLGLTKIRDVTSVQPFNVDLGARYMFNTKWGIELSGNYTSLKDYKWQSATFMGIANVGRVMNFEEFTDKWTILIGIGGNYEYNNSYTNQAIFHRLSNFHLAGNITNEYKLTNKIFLTAGLNVVPGVNSRPTQPAFHYTETTSILNFNVGVTISLGEHKEHADWYIEEPKESVVDTIYMKPTVNVQKEVIVNNFLKTTEFVFFENDVHTLDRIANNAIKKMAFNLEEGEKIHLTGYASKPASNDYNVILCEKRCKSIVNKLYSLGIQSDRVVIEAIGEIYTYDGLNEDLSRYVKMETK